MNLKGKRALVTGASRGIGLAIARALGKEGARVFMTARKLDDLTQARNELSDKGYDIDFSPGDLTDQNQIVDMFSRAMKFLDGIDILINNAGIGIRKTVAQMDITDWDRTVSLNLRAAFILSKLAAEKMISQKSGMIINIGSGASQTPIAELAAYCASKYGLLGFSESLALELRQHGIKVSIIMPGTTATNFGGSDPDSKLKSKPGILRPEDVAESVLYLLNQSPNAWTSIMNLRPLDPDKAH